MSSVDVAVNAAADFINDAIDVAAIVEAAVAAVAATAAAAKLRNDMNERIGARVDVATAHRRRTPSGNTSVLRCAAPSVQLESAQCRRCCRVRRRWQRRQRPNEVQERGKLQWRGR